MANDKRVLRLPAVMERTGLSKASNLPPHQGQRFPGSNSFGMSGCGVARRSDRRVDRLPRQHHRRCGQGPSGPTVNCSTSNAAHPHVRIRQGVANLDDSTERFRPWRGRDATG